MSDNQIPAWAVAMENRLWSRFDQLGMRLDGVETKLNGMETRSQAEARDIQLITEVTSAIQREAEAIRAELRSQGDRTRDDVAVAMGSVDHVTRRIETDREDVKQLRETVSMLHRRLRELEHWRDHRPGAAP